MYRKKSKLINNIENLGNYIDGFDVYDSLFLNRINNQSLTRENYLITVHEYRPDLIARDYYGSVSYMGILLAQTKMTVDQFKKGVVLSLLPKTTIESIISSL